MPMTGREIISHYTDPKRFNRHHGHKHGFMHMSVRPEFYSGRGARTGDLSSTQLSMIYDGVKNEYGDEAAANFVQFIYDFDVLSATAFLNQFYIFIGNNCQWEAKANQLIDHTDVGPDTDDGGERIAAGMATIANVLGGSMDRDETEQIRQPFLRKHKDEFTPDEKREQERRGSRYGMYGFYDYA